MGYSVGMTHRYATLFLVVAVACGSPAKTPEPAEPASSVSTATAEPEPDQPAVLDARIVAMVGLMEKFVVALEAAEGDCDRTLDAIDEFAHSDDGRAMRQLANDEEAAELAKASKDAVTAAYPTLEPRFIKVLSACPDQARMAEALDDSKLFVKRRADGTIVED